MSDPARRSSPKKEEPSTPPSATTRRLARFPFCRNLGRYYRGAQTFFRSRRTKHSTPSEPIQEVNVLNSLDGEDEGYEVWMDSDFSATISRATEDVICNGTDQAQPVVAVPVLRPMGGDDDRLQQWLSDLLENNAKYGAAPPVDSDYLTNGQELGDHASPETCHSGQIVPPKDSPAPSF